MQTVKKSLKHVRQTLQITIKQMKHVLVGRSLYEMQPENDDLPTQRNRYYT